MTTIDLSTLNPKDRYKLLCGVIIPRPIAWITTRSTSGVVNAAPFSFFNLFGKDPALVVLGLENRGDGTRKDTTQNIYDTGEFVINILTSDLTGDMVATAADYASDQSEPDTLGLELVASEEFAVPRLARAPAAIECRRSVSLTFTRERELLVGEALRMHARPGLIDTEKMYVNWGPDLPVARLFADRYAELHETERFSIPNLQTMQRESSRELGNKRNRLPPASAVSNRRPEDAV